jgi:VWFA-related protein
MPFLRKPAATDGPLRVLTVLLLTGAITSSQSLHAQNRATDSVPPLVEKVEVVVTNVDVTVLDSHANPVRGLTRDDFEVLEDGVRQPITNFYAVQKSDASRDAVNTAVPAAPKSAAAPPDERFRRRVMVLIDYTHTSKFRRDLALKNLETFIDTRFNGDYDWSIATMDRYIHLILPFTSNHDEIHTTFANIRQNRQGQQSGVGPQARFIFPEASQRPSAQPGVNSLRAAVEADAFLNFAEHTEKALMVEDSSRAILDAIHSLGALPGKKILMLVTGDLSLDEAVASFETMEGTAARGKYSVADNKRQKDLAILRDRMVADANASGVTIFVVNPEGLNVPDFDAGNGQPIVGENGVGRESHSFGASAPVWLSLQTGGQYFPGNSVALSLNQFDERSGNFYSLGYRPSAKSGYHKIAVKIRRPGRYTILARDGYALVDSEVALEQALQSNVGVASHPTSLPMTLSLADPHGAGQGKSTVPLVATVAMKDLQFVPRDGGSIGRLHIYLSIFDDRGRNVGFHHLSRDVKNSDSADGHYTFSTNVLLPSGHYQIAVALRDEVSESVGIAVGRVDI